jgi:predicted acetyltransferase
MEIRKLHDEDIQSYVSIISNAYPEFNFRTSEDKEKLKNRLLKIQNEDLGISFYGFFKDEKMLGGMRLHDFVMNYDGIDMAAGGVGLLAVDLCHKKEKVAKELITGFIEHYRNRGANIVLLYPFRPDFYKKMGFGYGSKINQYRVKPCDLP